MTSHFSAASFRFLEELAANNSRDWFQANKKRYEKDVKAPALALITAMAEPLKQLSPELVANPRAVGGSMFRINRDTRFSGDKRPYKTHVGITFYHAATRSVARSDAGNAGMGRLDAPLLYLHVAPEGSFCGGGIWHPQPATLKRLRENIVANPRSWQRATQSEAFTEYFALGGDSLVRPPRGYDPAHPLIRDLMRKDFVASTGLSVEQLTGADLVAALMQRYERVAPLMDWLAESLDLPF